MTAFKTILAIFSVLVCGTLMAGESAGKLKDSGDRRLQQDLEALVIEQNLQRAIDAKELSLALVVLSDSEKPRLAEINGRDMFYAASLPKIAILLGAAVAMDQGRLKMDEELRMNLEHMIRFSCNPCATRVLERVGRQELLDILQSPEYRFYDKHEAGGLWVGKDYGPGTAYQRDPVSSLSHGASAFQAARFYFRLNNGTLVSPEQSRMMLKALSNPGVPHKFVKGLAAYPNLEIYRKSGTWRSYHSDSALVRINGLAYIMVALAHNENGDVWLERLAAPLHELALSYKSMTQQ